MEEYGEDAAMPLDVSIFEPKTPFLFGGVIHNPGTEGSGENRGREGNGSDAIEVSHKVVVDEINKGLHEVTGRPNSALLNHCRVRKASDESRQMLSEFYSTVKRRDSAKSRIAVRAKKREAAPSGMVRVEEESFGVADAPGNGTGPPPVAPAVEAAPKPPKKKNKGGRPKGAKSKAKQNVDKILTTV